jgi:tRNA-guanine family transglycosylase
MTAPQFYCVLGNRDYLKVETPDGPVKEPIWKFIQGQDRWLTSLVYMRNASRAPGQYLLDCGAWSYKAEAQPRWTPQECLDRYATFTHPGDIVASPDHMVLRGMDAQEEQYRIDLTLDNARAFLGLCPPELRPIAVTHGSTLETRGVMLRELLEMGYQHIAIGSVAIRAGNRKFIRGILEDVAELRRQQPFYVHVLGVSALSWVAEFRDAGVDSYDGSSMFFTAFTAGEWLWHDGEGTLREYPVKRTRLEDIPACSCPPCAAMRAQGLDTREYGSNERNMGRAVHNINQYLAALAVALERPSGDHQPTLWETTA